VKPDQATGLTLEDIAEAEAILTSLGVNLTDIDKIKG